MRSIRTGVALAAWLAAGAVCAGPVGAEFGISEFDGGVFDQAGGSYTRAGGHPHEGSVTFTLNRVEENGLAKPDGGGLRNAKVDLPAGLVGNPTAVPTCPKGRLIPENTLTNQPDFDPAKACPVGSIVGIADITAPQPGGVLRFVSPVFNLQPPPGVAAQFGFAFAKQNAILDAVVRSDGDYGVSVVSRDINQAKAVIASTVTLWGVPGDPSHDPQRCLALPTLVEGQPVSQAQCNPFAPPWLAPSSAEGEPVAFLSNPTACTPGGVGLETRLHVDPWDPRSASDEASFISHLPPGFPLPRDQWGAPQGPTDCAQVPFDPSFEVGVDATRADAPTALSIDLGFPQAGLSLPEGLASAHLKRATVTLPDGMTISPSAAHGLVGCSDEQSRVGTLLGAECPDASKIGTVEATTPLLKEKLEGGVFVGTQKSDDPESGEMFRMFLALNSEERGIRVKLPGAVRVDRATGRVETTFDNNPQVPVSRISLRLKSGPRAPLATPLACGPKTVTADLEAWSGAIVTRADGFSIDCPGAQPLTPTFKAGTTDANAGAHTDFGLRVERPDGQQFMNGLWMTMPPGLLATLKGVPRCGDVEASAGTCSEASRVGTATVGAGPGVSPFFLSGGVYLTGPYKKGPFGLAVAIRAKAGPFDLGTVVVRQQLLIDPVDAQVTVVSDPLPTIVTGVPVRLRSLNVDVDRSDFVLNPTSCEQKSIVAAFGAVDGSVFSASSPFGVTNCAALPLKPKLSLALTGRGQTTDGKHPGVKALLIQRRGDANLKKVRVKLPLSLALDPDNAQALCEFADGAKVEPTCPAGSVVGRAKAVTPLLDEALEGPVYFVKNVRIDPRTGRSIRTLPMLVIPLRGQGVSLNLKGTSEVSRNRLVNTFAAIPDAPVSRFELTIAGGRNGILAVSNADVCRRAQVADAEIDGQNNKPADRAIVMRTPCTLKVLSAMATRRSVRLRVSGLGAGRLTVSGKGIRKASRTLRSASVSAIAARRKPAAGLASVRVSFDPAGAAKPRHVRVAVGRFR